MSKRIGIIPPASGSPRAGRWLGQSPPAPADEQRRSGAGVFALRGSRASNGNQAVILSIPRQDSQERRRGSARARFPRLSKAAAKPQPQSRPSALGPACGLGRSGSFKTCKLCNLGALAPLWPRIRAAWAIPVRFIDSPPSRFAPKPIWARRPEQKPGRPGPSPWAQTAPHPASSKLSTTGSPLRGASRGARRAAFL